MSVIASASKDIKFHQWPEGILQQNYLPKSHEGYIQSISWGKDGSWVVLVPDSGPTEIVSVKDNIKLLQSIQDVYRPTCASFHTTTKKLIGIGTLCGQVMIYDIKGKNIKKRFPRVSSKISSLCYNCKDTHIAATCNNGEILLLSNLVGNISSIYKVPNSSSVSSTSFHRSKRNLFAAGGDVGIVATWDINSNHIMCSIEAHQAPISSVTFSPLRVDLLVTGGLDRKFSFHDLSVHKPVLEIEVNNAITSLDFSHCGVYVGVGFQNGNIAIYDTRRTLGSPISVFEAHPSSSIRHLQFQKVLSNSVSNNSVFDITIEETPYIQEGGDPLSNNTSVIDSVEVMHCEDSSTHDRNTEDTKHSQEYVDSFMVAMGLDVSNQLGVTKNDSTIGHRVPDEYQKPTDSSKHHSRYKHTTGHHTTLQLSRTAHMKTSSTPKYPDAELPHAGESPIFAVNQIFPAEHQTRKTDSNCIAPNDLQDIIKDVIRQELRDIIREEIATQTESLKLTIESDLINTLTQVRRYFLDLQMSIVREFVNMEALLGKNSTPTEEVSGGLLINANMMHQEMNLREHVIERDNSPTRKV